MRLFRIIPLLLALSLAGCSESGNPTPVIPEVEFTSVSATVVPVSHSGAGDGQATLKATIVTDQSEAIARSGFEYRILNGEYKAVKCGQTLSPVATVTSLPEGTYEYKPFVFTVDDEFIVGPAGTFVISTDTPTEVTFSALNAEVTPPARKGEENGSAVLTAVIALSKGKATVTESGFGFRKAGATKYTMVESTSAVPTEPEATAENLGAGTYSFYAYARLSDGSSHSSEAGKFTVTDPESTEVSFDDISSSTTAISSTGAADGTATLAASITVPAARGGMTTSGFAYKASGLSTFTTVDCGKTTTPKKTISGLKSGKYEFYVYVSLDDSSTEKSSMYSFTVSDPETTSVTFSSVKASTSTVSKAGASDGKATVSATITLQGGQATAVETGICYKLLTSQTYTTKSTGDATLSPSVQITGLKEGTYMFYVYVLLSDGETHRSAASQFSISSPSTSKYQWAELPSVADSDGNRIDDGDNTLYYAYHLCGGGEKNAQGNGTARNYTVCYSSEYHCPVWVSAPRHSMYEQKKASRTDAYGKDPDIPSSIQYNSKDTGGGCNKGHMLGSAERLCSAATNRQVFYYTNIAPQGTSFNTGGGAWNNLEDHIDGLVCSDTLYVVIGCYFKSYTDRYGNTASPTTISFGGRSDVTKPTMFYYALLRTKSGSSGKRVADCSASELQCAAFVMSHAMEKGHKPQAKDMISVSELEALTGFTYFTNVPNAPKSTYSASDWDL